MFAASGVLYANVSASHDVQILTNLTVVAFVSAWGWQLGVKHAPEKWGALVTFGSLIVITINTLLWIGILFQILILIFK